MIWSSHSQYGLYHQSSRFRPQTPQDALIAQRLEEAADEIQTQYWKSLYPEKIKKIQQEIEHTCDELDYAGSFIYDEYPDKINLNRTGRQICERLRKNEEFREIPIEDLFEASGHDALCRHRRHRLGHRRHHLVLLRDHRRLGRQDSKAG